MNFGISKVSCIVTNSVLQFPRPAWVAQLDARPTGDQEIAGSTPSGRQHSFMEIDHKIFSMVILSLPLIHGG